MLTPTQCPHRRRWIAEDGAPAHGCDLAREILGLTSIESCSVGTEACEACCKTMQGFESLNPVVASIVWSSASRIIRNGGESGCTVPRAAEIQKRVESHLGLVLSPLSDRLFPPATTTPSGATTQPRRKSNGLRWAIAMLTAPRGICTIDGTLQSLRAADLSPDIIFAEPGSTAPTDLGNSKFVRHEKALGNYRNFYYCLSTLLQQYPDADCFAVFQDDIKVANGLRRWCDQEFWPQDAGIVSLFTARAHADRRPGWRVLFPGFHRVFGGQALVFRSDTLKVFLSDPQVISELSYGKHNDDAVVSAWATRRRLGIAYHTPSLVDHVGNVSSIYTEGPDRRVCAAAVGSVADVDRWQPATESRPKIALVGFNSPTGLGYQNRQLARQLPIDRWLIARCPYAPLLSEPAVDCCVLASDPSNEDLETLLAGVDWLLFSERPYLPNILPVAAKLGISVACIPNWELMSPRSKWLQSVDLMICPTHHTYNHVCDWSKRYSFGWNVIEVPWPVDASSFPFRLRKRCEQYVFIAGWLGTMAYDVHGRAKGYHRKGMELVIDAARLAPELPFICYSQYPVDRRYLPPNVELREAPASNTELYDDGDVCVQPSHWEGVGLQLLECQAAGMPLITTDAPPMNEYNALATIPVHHQEIVGFRGDTLISSNQMLASELVRILRRFHRSDICHASQAAREYIVAERNWQHARERILPHLARHRS